MDQHYEEPNYMAVFYALIVLTGIELWVANQNAIFGRRGVIIALVALAFTKAAMVALWYMHLKMEKWLLYGICAMPCVLVLVLLSGTMPDVGRPKRLEPYWGAPYPRTHETSLQKEEVAAPAAEHGATGEHAAESAKEANKPEGAEESKPAEAKPAEAKPPEAATPAPGVSGPAVPAISPNVPAPAPAKAAFPEDKPAAAPVTPPSPAAATPAPAAPAAATPSPAGATAAPAAATPPSTH